MFNIMYNYSIHFSILGISVSIFFYVYALLHNYISIILYVSCCMFDKIYERRPMTNNINYEFISNIIYVYNNYGFFLI